MCYKPKRSKTQTLKHLPQVVHRAGAAGDLEPFAVAAAVGGTGGDVLRVRRRTEAEPAEGVVEPDRAMYSQSLGEAILARRFAEVERLLASPDQALEPIANLCGWKSPAHLMRSFKRRYGMTMSKWRKVRGQPITA